MNTKCMVELRKGVGIQAETCYTKRETPFNYKNPSYCSSSTRCCSSSTPCCSIKMKDLWLAIPVCCNIWACFYNNTRFFTHRTSNGKSKRRVLTNNKKSFRQNSDNLSDVDTYLFKNTSDGLNN
jgi:hypothetical protein